MSQFIEAVLLLLPHEAGGRAGAIAPREGSYRPYARMGSRTTRVRVIEGPPLLAPGEAALVMLEVESELDGPLRPGAELALFEHHERMVGVVTVIRVCRLSISA
jgi:hypothetical protein